MRSHASLLLLAPLLIAAQQPDPAIAGPRATAGNGAAGAYDHVGNAVVEPGAAFTAEHRQLPLGSVAEVTALDSGRITLVRVVARPAQEAAGEIVLSAAAAQSIGVTGDRGAVRVRSIQPSAADLAALRSGSSAAPRLPAPEALLRGLRREAGLATVAEPTVKASAQLPVRQAPPSRVSTVPKPRQAASAPMPRANGPVVQVAALRDEARARAVARLLGGHVEQSAGLWRIRLGPFADRQTAQRARDAAVSRGYGGASIIQAP